MHALFLFLQVETDVSVFEFNIHYIGGLLGAYSLSGDGVCVCVHQCVIAVSCFQDLNIALYDVTFQHVLTQK